MANAKRDNNRVTTLLGVSNSDGITPVVIYADPVTHRLLVDIPSANKYTDVFTSTNLQTTFTATHTPTDTDYVSINGSIQTPSTDYTISSNTLTLANPIPSGNIVLWRYTY